MSDNVYSIAIKKRWFNRGYRWRVYVSNWGESTTLAKGKSPMRYDAAADAQRAARNYYRKTLPENADRWCYEYDAKKDVIVPRN